MFIYREALLLFACKGTGPGQSPDLYVNAVKAVSLSGTDTKEFRFIAQPFRTTELSFRVGGAVDRLDVYAGTRYSQGSMIAGINGFLFLYKRIFGLYGKNYFCFF